VLRSITFGTVTLVGGDVYIGSNVAAMGPQALPTRCSAPATPLVTAPKWPVAVGG
jgi:hypothetical protein